MTNVHDLPDKRPDVPRVVHLATTDMSLDWLIGPQLQAFAAAGYEVIGMSAVGPHVAHLEAMGIPHIDVPAFTRSLDALQDVRAFGQMVRLLRAIRPDILHTHNPKPGVLGRVAGRLARVPLVVNTQHGLYAQPTDRLRKRVVVYAAERFAAACSHIELVQNPEDVDTLVHRLKVPRRKVSLLGNGIDLDRFDPESVPAHLRSAIRSEWGIGPDEVLVGVVSRLVREKGIIEVLEAAHALRSDGLPIRLVILGPAEPDKADAVTADDIARALADGVVFAGQRSDMPHCYAAMDLFLSASWREGFPRSAMEATAMRLPTIATDVRGNRQVVDDGVTGILVPVRNATLLADGVRTMLSRRDEWPAFADACSLRARTMFDQQVVIERTLTAYQRSR